MIKVKFSTPVPLGDCIDAVLFAHMVSHVKNEIVNLECNVDNRVKYFNSIIDLGNVKLNSKESCTESYNYSSGFAGIRTYMPFSNKVKDIRTKRSIPEFDIDLPDKFVTVQWDAGQAYRLVDRWDKDRVKNIEQYYRDLGYDIVDIGNRKYSPEQCAYIISKAEYHIGADSGMMHIAKLVLPIENLHLYINIRNRENDRRFPDNWNVAFMARELFRRGVKMNYCENPSQEQIDYFKDTSIYGTR